MIYFDNVKEYKISYDFEMKIDVGMIRQKQQSNLTIQLSSDSTWTQKIQLYLDLLALMNTPWDAYMTAYLDPTTDLWNHEIVC